MSEIVVTEDIVGVAMQRLCETHDVRFEPTLWNRPDDLAAALQTAKAIIVRNQTQVTRELIQQASQLRIIARAGAGLDNVDTRAAAEAGVVVSYAPSENSVSVAELVLGLMLSLVRRLPAAWQDTRNGGWDRIGFTGGELFQKTLGIVGLGRIGRLVAQRAAAFGMRLIAHDDFVDSASPQIRELNVELVSLPELLAASDFVSAHVPLTDQTRAMFNSQLFGQMKLSAFFINASRGETVSEIDLLAALRDRRIAGAALDVRTSEPPAIGEFEKLDNVILTPHIGAFTHEAQERVVETVCRDVAAVLSGGEATSVFLIKSR
ncbi:hydroxyacid dehydrogenase [bacterium]|nr:hydroxyacid dehydrogenase [bacterium]